MSEPKKIVLKGGAQVVGSAPSPLRGERLMLTEPVILSPAAERAELAHRHYQLLTLPGKRAFDFGALPLQYIRRALATGDPQHVARAFKVSTEACIEAGVR